MRCFVLLSCLFTAACVAEAPPAFTMQGCRAAEYGALIGAPLAAVSLPADLNDRVITTGETVSDVSDPSRLNLFVDQGGIITALACG